MQVDLVSPAYSEEGNLRRMVDKVMEVAADHEEWDYRLIFIVNDNDLDNTPQIADELAEEHDEIETVHRSSNPGIGNALRDGLKKVKGDVFIPITSDLADDPADIPKMLEKIEEGYDVVYGSRFLEESSIEGYPDIKMYYNRFFNNVTRLMFGIRSKDISNGFTAYRTEFLGEVGVENLESQSFDFTVELPLRARVRGFEETEVPVTWRCRDVGESKFDPKKEGPLYGKRLLHMFVLDKKHRAKKTLKRLTD